MITNNAENCLLRFINEDLKVIAIFDNKRYKKRIFPYISVDILREMYPNG